MCLGEGKSLLKNSSIPAFFIPPPPALIIFFQHNQWYLNPTISSYQHNNISSFPSITIHSTGDSNHRHHQMDADKGSHEVALNNRSNGGDAPESCPDNGETSEHILGKAVARRAVFGSNQRGRRGRRARNIDTRRLPSRLSKVSLADEDEY